MPTQTKNHTHVLPTFLPEPDGREVDVEYWYDPGPEAEITLWDVVAVDGTSLILTLPPAVLKGLEAECLADAGRQEEMRRCWWPGGVKTVSDSINPFQEQT